MINPAFATDNVQMTTRDFGCHELTLLIGHFFEAAEAAAVANLFPVCHCCGLAIIVVPRLSFAVPQVSLLWQRYQDASLITCDDCRSCAVDKFPEKV